MPALPASTTTDDRFRSRVVMARHGFGRGEYKYFAYPLPELVAELRTALYPRLSRRSRTAGTRRWASTSAIPASTPSSSSAAIAPARRRPTPLLLRYGAGDYNCLHQDLYGEHVFPLQVAMLLSGAGADFTGGEFVLTEQRPRMQSRAEVVPLAQGDAVIFPVHHRPVRGTRGVYRVNLRHGVSRRALRPPAHARHHLPRRAGSVCRLQAGPFDYTEGEKRCVTARTISEKESTRWTIQSCTSPRFQPTTPSTHDSTVSCSGGEIQKMDFPGRTRVLDRLDRPDRRKRQPVRPGVNGGLTRRQHPGQPPVNYVSVENVDEYARKAKGLGAEEVMAKTPVKGMGWFAWLKDTEGNVWIWQTDDAAG